jgi:hypothetical protein
VQVIDSNEGDAVRESLYRVSWGPCVNGSIFQRPSANVCIDMTGGPLRYKDATVVLIMKG